MKTSKKLFVALLAVAMLFVLTACGVKPDNTCTVTFYNGTEVYKTVEVNKGEKITMPKDPKGESGKGLRGWSTIDGDVEEIIDPTAYVVEADVSLYAIWADVYTVVINADNGTAFDIKEVFAGTIIEKPADPVKEGFKFIEWRDALAEVPFDFTQGIYADVTIKAMYGDGSPNRVSDTKWDFTLGHGSWIGSMGGWGRVENGIPCEDMVYHTTEDGYAAWGFTLTDSVENIPVINGENGKGMGMKFLYNEGISVDAAQAKLLVVYVKPKYFPMDIYGDLNDQFRTSILTGNGGMIYGYGSGSEDWAIHSAGLNKELVQADIMEDGWIRVQFKIHELKVWSEDTVIKSLSISIVQRPGNPVMDIISVKSIELLDQEEFIDPHKIEYVTKNEWDMSKAEDAADWLGAMQNGSNTTSVTTTVTENGTSYVYGHTNAWRAVMLSNAKIDISKCSGIFSATIDISGMSPTQYRLYIVTDKGGDPTKNKDRDDISCYYVTTSPTELTEGWSITPNADGTITISYDMTKLEYWNGATELHALTFVTVDSSANGTVVYKSISLTDEVKAPHNCETDGHIWKDATCTTPKTCVGCGITEGEPAAHTWIDATCTAPKTCSVCGAKDGGVADHTFVEGVCSVCGEPEVTPVVKNSWDLSNSDDAADWNAYHAMKLNEALTSAVTNAGFEVTFGGSGNGWKGISMANAAINISKLTGKLTFTYSCSDMAITQYRVYVVTDQGGDALNNNVAGLDKANYYVAVKIADIDAGTATAWTKTVNDDGSITVTFDLTTVPFFANGTELKALTVCTVTANSTTGTVAYKSIELEKNPPIVWDMKNADDSAQWYATQNKDITKTGSLTLTEAGTLATYTNTNAWKGMLLREAEIDISKQQGILSFTYKTELPMDTFRIYVLSDLGGSLTHNDEATAGTPKANFYSEIKVAAIADSEHWTSTVNEDGTTTVTFDLTTIPFYKNGTTLKGLTIVTVNGKVDGAAVAGEVLYTEIAVK